MSYNRGQARDPVSPSEISTPKPSAPLRVTERIASIDVLRGLTMLLMLLANDIGDSDLGHIQGGPQWLRHMPLTVDGMTMPDAVWPTFMLIVGLAIPLSLEGRFARGDSWKKVLGHVVARAAALIFIGVCMVNGGHQSPLDAKATGMSGPVWGLLMFLGVVVLWNAYPRTQGFSKWLFMALRVAGAALLVYLLVIYRADEGGRAIWLRPRWWGIIGLIGWAYLIAALIWLACRDHGAAIMGALALLMALNIGAQLPALDGWWHNHVEGYTPSLPDLAWLSAAAVAGMVLATLFRPCSGDCPDFRVSENGTVPFRSRTPRGRIAWMLVFAAGLAAAGLLLWPFWGVHKRAATPSWLLYSLVIATTVYALLYWLVDVKKISRWTVLVGPAGSNTLLMYFLPHIFYSLLALGGITYLETHFHEGWPGVARSAALAVFFVALTGLLTRCRIRLRL